MTEERGKLHDSRKIRPLPEDYGTITPYLMLKGAARLIDCLKTAFGTVEAADAVTQTREIQAMRVLVSDGRSDGKRKRSL